MPEVWNGCDECGGDGCIEMSRPQPDDPYFAIVLTCQHCGGAGWVCEVLPAAAGSELCHDIGEAK